MIKEKVVIPIKQRLFCDECGKEMHHNGENLMSNPAQYVHECDNGHTLNVRGKIYPYVKYSENVEIILETLHKRINDQILIQNGES